ncbi:hypothetical protein [Paraflavitalea speifideaquila]|uniref:hypothetical protein n=1 Tax=Paraflavitalea speifideaquila TaxID=3076558 RepID=UPI0028E56594|nr:hypothetical protein [Paraflavitalea speifideiaquila]
MPDGRFIISSDKGLFTYDVRRKLLQAMKPPPSRFNRWYGLVVDGLGRIWLAADTDGLICWDYRNGRSRNYSHQITP